jgi:hypothetical protein
LTGVEIFKAGSKSGHELLKSISKM